MPEFDPRNTYRLYVNEKAGENKPYITGTFIDGNGKEWDVAAWEKTSKQGNTYYWGRLKEPYVKPEGQSGYDKFKQQGAKLKDTALEDISDEAIDLSEIPFN